MYHAILAEGDDDAALLRERDALLIGDAARTDTYPTMEIDEDDVCCNGPEICNGVDDYCDTWTSHAEGSEDPRVAQAESDQIVHALTDRGREVEYIVYEDEGHGFSRKENEFNALKRTVDFLDRHV